MYAEFYGLAAPAFQLTPDVRFFFESAVHRRAMAYMVYGLRHTQGFIIITGEVGAGKTILVNNLLSTVKDNSFVTANIVFSQLAGDDLLHLVAAGFGIVKEGLAKGPLLQRINEFLLTQHRSGKRALLIVDEAQNLSFEALEELRMLSNVVVDGATALQSLLLGQPQFHATLGSRELEQLRQRITAAYHLSPLNEPETRAYIEHRLRLADWKGDPHFAEACFPSIYLHTKGLPRRINTLCSRLLLHGSLEQLHTLTANTVDKVANDLREEIASVATSPGLATVGSERPAAGEVLRRPKLSPVPRSTRPPEHVPAPPSVPAVKLWKRQNSAIPARGSVFLALATVLLCLIAGIQCYILWTTGASTRRTADNAQSATDTAKATLVQIPSVIQPPANGPSPQRSEVASDDGDQGSGEKSSTYNPDATLVAPPSQPTQMPQEAPARAMLAPTEDHANPQSVSPTAQSDPGRPAQVPSAADAPPSARGRNKHQTSSSAAGPTAMKTIRLPEPTPLVSPPLNPRRAILEAESSTASPPPGQSSSSQDLSLTEIAALVARGDSFIDAGDIASARLFYERAANAGYGPAALRLGTTFDPSFLMRARLLRGVPGDARQAAFWYDRARDLEDNDAPQRLNALDQERVVEPNSPPH